jgi:hypothetical protein
MSLAPSIACSLLLLAADAPPTDGNVRAAVERSLPFIEAEGQRWIDEKKCVTCHQVPFMVWSVSAAESRGLAADCQKLDTWRAWAIDWQHMANKEQLEKGRRLTLENHPDAVAQLLLSRGTNQREAVAADWPALFAECLAAGQQPDGSWKAGGQLPGQKRPVRETNEVTTMWAMLALHAYAPAADSFRDPMAKARAWLGSKTVGESTEWWAARLLIERAAGNTVEAERIREALCKSQHDDGGWGWLTNDESDAFGTGLALYALARDGLAADHPAIAQGRNFLIRTQQSDGSWSVRGTKKSKSQQIEPTATYWGTCWAVIGLAETMPPSMAK